MKRNILTKPMPFLAFALMLGLCVGWAGCGKRPTPPPAATKLRVLCGSSMAAPVQELVKQFAAAHPAQPELDLGGSETLLPKILAGTRADLFVCHDPFEEKLKAAGRWTNTVVVGYLEPVLAVRPGNPKGIRGLADLAKPGLKIGLGDPRYSTCGELFVNALRARGLQDRVLANVMLQARSHAEVANGLVVGPLDAVVVWNFVVGLYPGKLEVVPTGITYPATRVTVIGLTSSDNPALRDAFLAWCRQSMVQETFRRYGYTREKE
ncbi:MAG: substrate-binding domain-containing protein [Verrucomicrobiota bacterium]